MENIAGEQILAETKSAIYKHLQDATNTGHFIHGIDTDKLVEIYNGLTINNAAEMRQIVAKMASDQISQRVSSFNYACMKLAGTVFLGGAVVAGSGYVLSKVSDHWLFEKMTNGGILVMVLGTAILFSIGH